MIDYSVTAIPTREIRNDEKLEKRPKVIVKWLKEYRNDAIKWYWCSQC